MNMQSAHQACPEVVSTLVEGMLHITLEREAKKNALTMPMFSAFAAALADAGTNNDVKSILVSGKGSAFSAGHDLHEFSQWPQSLGDPVPQFLHALERVEKPLVMAVHGAAVGIGATMLLHADWVCCTADAYLRYPFIDIGIGPEAGSSLLLSQTIGLMRARRLMLSGESFSGKQAYEWGLVSEIVALADLPGRASERARMLGEKPAGLFRQIKQWSRPAGAEISARIDAEIALINQNIAAFSKQP